jgi:HSP20 family molecular chaperone IbpA
MMPARDKNKRAPGPRGGRPKDGQRPPARPATPAQNPDGGINMLDVEQAIREVGQVYQALTGRTIEVGRAELPPEIEPRAYLEDRYRKLKSILAAAPPVAADASFDPVWAPPLAVVEAEHEVRYELDLPSVPRDQVSLAVVGDWLLVRGRRGGVPAPGVQVRYTERPGGAFQRVLALPPRARRDAIQASMREGVLTIGVPTDGPGGAAAQPIEVK